jgi:hypothetical protein
LEQRVLAIVTLAAPTNGTTAYDLTRDPDFDAKRVKVPLRYKLWDRILKAHTKIKADDRDPRDWASFDMLLDNAQALNARITTLPHVYYLSVACDATKLGADGARVPDTTLMDPLFVRTGTLMGCYHGTTKAGCVVDNAWYANDGLVNTLSARAPLGAPQKPFDRSDISDLALAMDDVVDMMEGVTQAGRSLETEFLTFDYFIDLCRNYIEKGGDVEAMLSDATATEVAAQNGDTEVPTDNAEAPAK